MIRSSIRLLQVRVCRIVVQTLSLVVAKDVGLVGAIAPVARIQLDFQPGRPTTVFVRQCGITTFSERERERERERWNLSQEAATMALQKKIRRHSEGIQIKLLLEDTAPRQQGHIFCLRKIQPTKCHWVCLKPKLYIDDVHCMKIKDYHLAVAILRCLEHTENEFGKEYSTTTTRVKKNDLIELATYVKKSNKNWLHKCENKKVAQAGPNKDTAVKNNSEGEDKGEHFSLQPQKQTTVPPNHYRSSNKNGKHRNAKRRRKAKTA